MKRFAFGCENKYRLNVCCVLKPDAPGRDFPLGVSLFTSTSLISASFYFVLKIISSKNSRVGIMSKILEDFRIEAMEEGRMEGRIEGKKEGAINAARLMLQDGTLSLEKIAVFAGLTYDEKKPLLII